MKDQPSDPPSPMEFSYDPAQSLMRDRLLDPPGHPGVMASLDRYEIIRELGHGAMGVVFLARDPSTHKQVAIKVMRPELAREPRAVHRFLSEARHMADLAHPCIIPVLEVSDRRDGPYFVMPFIERGSVSQLIEPGKSIKPAWAVRIALGLAQALRFAHDKGIIHRDLKPANVLVDNQGNPFLTDFGLARTLFNDSIVDVRGSQREGTAPYMAPEIVRGEAGDTRCDIYSWGALMYEVFTGSPPYHGQTTEVIFAQITAGPPHPILDRAPQTPPALAAIVDWAMARELRDRYASMADVVADLMRVEAGHEPRGPRGQAADRRRPLAWIVAATGAVILLALALWWTNGPGRRAASTTPAIPTSPATVSAATVLRGGNEILVGTTGSPERGVGPLMACDATGRFLIVWDDLGFDGDGKGVQGRFFAPDGSPLGPAFHANTTTQGDQWFCRCAMNARGEAVVAWTADDGDDLGVRARWFDPAGKPRGPEVAVNVETHGEQIYPWAAIGPDGTTLIVWQSTRSRVPGIFARRFDSAGKPLGEPFAVTDDPRFMHWLPHVAMHRDGSAVVAWVTKMADGSDDGVFARRYDAAARPVGPIFAVNTYSLGKQRNPITSFGPDGGFLISWNSEGQDSSEWGVYAQNFTPAGDRRRSEFRVNQTVAGRQLSFSSAALDAGSFLVVWSGPFGEADPDGLGAYGRIFDALGVARTGEFGLTVATEGDQVAPAAASRGDGGFIVAWQHRNAEIRARLFAPPSARKP